MKTLVVHGIYDSQTLKTLKGLGIREFSFDLRTLSLNFIPMRDLSRILSDLTSRERVFLTFENDRTETIHSALDLIKSAKPTSNLIFRDQRPASFYKELGKDFYWMFHPESDWKNIIQLENLRGIFLPLKFQLIYQSLGELWDFIDKKGLEVYLHSDNFEEILFTSLSKDIRLSLDLTREVESHYRVVDQGKLQRMKIWSKLNEDTAGQR